MLLHSFFLFSIGTLRYNAYAVLRLNKITEYKVFSLNFNIKQNIAEEKIHYKNT